MENECDRCGRLFRKRRYLLDHKKRVCGGQLNDEEDAALTAMKSSEVWSKEGQSKKPRARRRTSDEPSCELKMPADITASSRANTEPASNVSMSSLDELTRKLAISSLAELRRSTRKRSMSSRSRASCVEDDHDREANGRTTGKANKRSHTGLTRNSLKAEDTDLNTEDETSSVDRYGPLYRSHHSLFLERVYSFGSWSSVMV